MSDTDDRITVCNLEPHHCRWPIGDPVLEPDTFRFCGAQRAGDMTSYCEEHRRAARQSASSAPSRPFVPRRNARLARLVEI